MRIPLLNLFIKDICQRWGSPPEPLFTLVKSQRYLSRITITDYNETHLQEEETQTVEACVPFIDTETVTWIQIEGIHEIPIIEEIGEHFGVDPAFT